MTQTVITFMIQTENKINEQQHILGIPVMVHMEDKEETTTTDSPSSSPPLNISSNSLS